MKDNIPVICLKEGWNLPLGGLKVPCRLKFSGASKEISKIIKLLSQAPPGIGCTTTIAKPSTVSKPEPVSSNSAFSPMGVKHDPDEAVVI